MGHFIYKEMESGTVGQTLIDAPLHVVVVWKQEPIHVLGLVVAGHVAVLEVQPVIQLIVVRLLARHTIQ